MIKVASNTYAKAADDTAMTLLRGATAKAAAAADASRDDNASRGPASSKKLSPAAQAVSMLRTSLNSLQPALDEDVVDALSDQLEETSDTLTKLDQAKQGMIGDRKAAAEQKLEMARKKLALLRALGGDPKTIARQAKAIAQEIKAAAIAYGEALKAQGESGGAAAPVADAGMADPAASTDPATAGAAPAEFSSETAAKTGSTEASPQDAALAQDPAGQAKAEAKAGEHDREVLEAFKEAAREVKRLLQEAARKLKAQHAADPDGDRALKAGSEMDKAIEDLSEIVRTGGTGVDAAITAASVPVTPTIDFQV